jgi:hypothetical protein
LAAKGVPYEELVKEGHNIKKLFNRCERLYDVNGLCEFISPEHWLLLDPLTLYIKWGKYTLPKDVNELARLWVTVGVRLGGSSGWLPARKLPFSDLSSLCDKLASYLELEIEHAAK